MAGFQAFADLAATYLCLYICARHYWATVEAVMLATIPAERCDEQAGSRMCVAGRSTGFGFTRSFWSSGATCARLSYMRETLTISLPKDLRRGLEKMAKAEGVTSSEFVRRALKADIFRRAMRAARRELVPQARTLGIYTDEDVFKAVS